MRISDWSSVVCSSDLAPAGMEESGILARSVWYDRLMVALQSGHRLLQSDRIYWSDLRREVFVVPGGGIGPTLANLLAARPNGQGWRPHIILQNTRLERLLNIVSVSRYIVRENF